MEEKITLDRKTFKALSSDTRVEILKLLSRRRFTLTELAKIMGMSVSTVKEHLEGLTSVSLIKQIDDGHKWKYYSLTSRGKEIVSPVEKKVFILLGLSALVMIAGVSQILSPPVMMQAAMEESLAAPARGVVSQVTGIDMIPLAITLIAGIVLGISAGYIISRKR